MLTVEELKAVVPDHLKRSVTQGLADKVNQISTDPEACEVIRNTVVGYTSVLKEGKFKLDDFVNAAAYVSYKLMGNTNQDAWVKTFPVRYQNAVARGLKKDDLSSYVAVYNKSKLVNLLMEQAMIPVWVLNQDLFQKAVQEQAMLMVTAKSDMVRMQAANSLMMHLKPPEKKQVELAITTPESSGLNELKDLLTSVAQRQRELIEKGATTREIAHQKLGICGAESSGNLPEMIDVTPAVQS